MKDIIKDVIKIFKYIPEGKSNFKEDKIEVYYDLDQNISEIYIHIWGDLYKQKLNGISKEIFKPKIEFINNKLYFISELLDIRRLQEALSLIDETKKEIIELIKIIVKNTNIKEALIFLRPFEYSNTNQIIVYLDISEFIIYINNFLVNIIFNFKPNNLDVLAAVKFANEYNNLDEVKERINKKQEINLEYISKAFLKKHFF
jgi:hypothetical protein